MSAIIAWLLNSWFGRYFLNFFWGKLVELISTGVTKLVDYVEEQRRLAEIKKKDEKLLKEYQDAVAKGAEMSREERRKLANDLLNRNA